VARKLPRSPGQIDLIEDGRPTRGCLIAGWRRLRGRFGAGGRATRQDSRCALSRASAASAGETRASAGASSQAGARVGCQAQDRPAQNRGLIEKLHVLARQAPGQLRESSGRRAHRLRSHDRLLQCDARQQCCKLIEHLRIIRRELLKRTRRAHERRGEAIQTTVQEVARRGSTPLLVSDGARVLGVIELKDIVKGGIKERFGELRRMGIKTVMITGDNKLTAAAIAQRRASMTSWPRHP